MSGEGRTLGAYRLVSQIAVGGMAEIYAAKTDGVGGFEKLVALKVIHPNYSEDPEFVQMLVDEAKLAVQLTHANIVQTFDLGRIDQQYYIAMELIDGVDLYKLLRTASERDVPFPFEVAAFIANETAQGLDYAHRKRDPKGRPLEIVHRDISPQNVLVSYDGEVKIVDFGIAKAALRGRQTAAGVIKGKYYYMSPEQAWGDPIDARTDIFAAGILLYEMLVGQMLYLEEDLEALLAKVRKAEIQPPSQKRKDVPPELEAIVMRALKKRPQERFQTANELAQALAQFLHRSAPDFNRVRLGAFVHEIVGTGQPTHRNIPRDPRVSTAFARDALPSDENSLLFKLSDLKPPQPRVKPVEPRAKPAPAPPSPRAAKLPDPRAKAALAPAPSPRPRDQSTRPVSLPEVQSALASSGDYGESDQTIVDMSDNRPAMVDGESTRPMGNAHLRELASLPLTDDPAADPQPNLAAPSFDDEDEPTHANAGKNAAAAREAMRQRPTSRLPEGQDEGERPLPGVRRELARVPPSSRGDKPAPARAPSPPRPPPPARAAPPKLPPLARPSPPRAPATPLAKLSDEGATEDEATAQHKKPTRAPVAPEPQEDEAQEDEARPTLEIRKPRGLEPEPAAPAASFADDDSSPTATALPAPVPPAPQPAPSTFDEPTLLPPPAPPLQTSQRLAWPLQPQATFDADATLTPVSPNADPAAMLVGKKGRTGLIVALAGGLVALCVGIGLYAGLGGAAVRGTLQVVSLPPGAEVRLDDKALTQPTPVDIADVDPQAPHHVHVSKAGFDVWETDVRFEPGSSTVRLQAVLVPTVGKLMVTSMPAGAEVIVNGRIRGLSPVAVGDLPVTDEVAIELRLRGYKVAHLQVPWPAPRDGSSKRTLDVNVPLEKAR